MISCPLDKDSSYPDSATDPHKRVDCCFVSFDLIPRVQPSCIVEDDDHQPVWTEFELGK